MVEYKLRITSQNPVVISQDQFNALRDKDGRMKFGNVNEMVSLGGVGFNLKDVRGWEEIHLDPMPRGFESAQTHLNQEGIRKLRLLTAAIHRKAIGYLGKDEQAEVAGIIRDHEARLASGDYAKRKLFAKLHYDVWYKDSASREAAYQHWSKSSEALEANIKDLNSAADELFLSPTEEVKPATLSSGEEEVQRVKEILTNMKPEDEGFELPF